MRADPDWPLLERLCRGECSAAEEALVRRRLLADPALAALIDELRRQLDAGARELAPPDARESWRAVRDRMRAADAAFRPILVAPAPRLERTPAPLLHWRRRPAPPRRRWAALAAAAALLLAVGISIVRTRAAISRAPEVAATPTRTIETGRGQQATVDLSDGTRVVLAADSRLRIPSNFNVRTRSGTSRELYLEGKAYFEVRHDSTRPFLVHTATAVAEDIGTEFVVVAYPEMHATQVAVAGGEVAMRLPGSRTGHADDPALQLERSPTEPLATLTRGMLGYVDSAGTLTVTRHVDPDAYLAWMKGILVFQAVPLDDVARELSRWYDVDVQLGSAELAARRITAELRDESLDETLRRLRMILGITVERDSGTIVVGTRAGAARAHRP
jgi:ferric-dicitrate binding protein FerR (iron transport regulator)